MENGQGQYFWTLNILEQKSGLHSHYLEFYYLKQVFLIVIQLKNATCYTSNTKWKEMIK